MNSFGRIFRVSIFGESHGKGVGVLIDGCPPGIPLHQKDFLPDLQRRKGRGKGTTTRREEDLPLILSGIFEGKTSGAPILIFIKNKDVDSKPYDELRHIPRPSHADFTAFVKYRGFNDYRGGGYFSGRLTAGLVAAGVIAKKIIFPVKLRAYVKEVGGSREIDKIINKIKEEGDSIGGIVECVVENVPPGWGEPFFDSVESLISHAVFSIPGIKGIEFGAGFKCATMKGSEFNDQILSKDGKTSTNNSGGINGGISNGNPIVFRVAVRPPASIAKPQRSVNLKTGEKVNLSVKGRHDSCIAIRMPPILEAVTAIVLADLKLINNSSLKEVK